MSTTSPSALIDRTRELVARRRRRRVALATAAALPVAALVLVLLDASAALPTWARALVLLLLLLSLAGVTLLLVALWRWLRPDDQHARRLAEHALADDHRHLSTALELAAMPGPLAAQAAGQFAAGLDATRLEAGLPAVRARRALLVAAIALFLSAGIHLIWPTVLPAVLPRLYDPFGDHPPWSRTALTLVDPPARVRPPATPRLVVRTTGPQPKELILHAEDAAGTPVARVALLAIGGDQWAANLGPLTAEHVTTLVSPLRLWVEGAGTRTYYHALAIDPVPSLTGGELTHISPAYARVPAAVVKLAALPPVIHTLPGSRVTVQVSANRPLRTVELFRDGRSEHRATAATVTLDDPAVGTWTLVLEAEDGIRSEPLPLMSITRRVDQPPTVRFEQPQSDGVATPDMHIPLVIHAQDDLGLTRLTRYRLRNDQRETEGRDDLGGTGDTWRGRLSTTGMKPGDAIRIGAVVADTQPPVGQVSAPAERVIHIISHGDYNALVMEQIDQHALEQKYAELLGRIAELEQQLTDTKQSAPSPERSAKLEALAERAAELSQQVAALRRPEPLFAIEPHLQDELERHLKALEQHARAAKEGAPSEATPQAAERMRQELAAMTAAAEAEALRDHLRDLAAAQRQTADELADLARHGIRNDADRARLREASRRQQEMEQALKEWHEAAQDVAKRLEGSRPQDAEKLHQLADQVAQCEAERLVAQAGRAGRAGRAGEAHGDAEEAARRLAAVAGSSGQGQGQGQQPGWCPGQGYAQCQSQLQGLAKRGYSASSGSSGGGATGARGGGMIVRRGGRSTPNGAPMQLFGPEVLSALGGATSGQQRSGAPNDAAAAGDADQARAATAYATGTRTTTAGVGATFSPGEQVLIEDYFRRLEGDALAPVPPLTPPPPLTPTTPAVERGNTSP
ncbi:MAG: hypothetical protein H0W78_00140 [Planctomycetes bacterium]|nr:hypothetical protein [Planctomycetota bacterium]